MNTIYCIVVVKYHRNVQEGGLSILYCVELLKDTAGVHLYICLNVNISEKKKKTTCVYACVSLCTFPLIHTKDVNI